MSDAGLHVTGNGETGKVAYFLIIPRSRVFLEGSSVDFWHELRFHSLVL